MTSEDPIDWIAAALFAIASLFNGFWGLLLMVTLIGLPLGLVYLVVAALLWYAARGVFSRDSEAWWAGFLVVLALTITTPISGGPALFFGLGSPVLGVVLLVYLIVRRERYGIGVVRGTGYEKPSKGT